MMKILLPVLLGLVGFVGGAGAGWWMQPKPEPDEMTCVDEQGEERVGEICVEIAEKAAEAAKGEAEDASDSEFVELERQFIVPVVSEDRVASMMVLSLDIEVAPGNVEAVFRQEPKLRDAMLRTLFEHAYTGGFNGDFTAERRMKELRRNLLIAAREVAGEELVRDVLVSDIIKQDQ